MCIRYARVSDTALARLAGVLARVLPPRPRVFLARAAREMDSGRRLPPPGLGAKHAGAGRAALSMVDTFFLRVHTKGL